MLLRNCRGRSARDHHDRRRPRRRGWPARGYSGSPHWPCARLALRPAASRRPSGESKSRESNPLPGGVQQRLFGWQVLGPHHHDRPRLLLDGRADLDDAEAQDRVEQDRQDEDHEQRAPVADLVADLAAEDHEHVRPAHGSVSSRCRRARSMNGRDYRPSPARPAAAATGEPAIRRARPGRRIALPGRAGQTAPAAPRARPRPGAAPCG